MTSARHPIAGPRENLISGRVSNETFRALAEIALETGDLMGAAAVMTGGIDGLARYAASVQLTDTSAEDVSAVFARNFSLLFARYSSIPQGEA